MLINKLSMLINQLNISQLSEQDIERVLDQSIVLFKFLVDQDVFERYV